MQLLRPQVSLAGRLVRAHLTVTSCFQCRKCSSGCPLSFAMDLFPDQVIRLALLGQEDQVLGSRTIWVCSGCETCTSRCPNGIDIAGVMDWLKGEAARRGQAVEAEVAAFHRLFLESIRACGRPPAGNPPLAALYPFQNATPARLCRTEGKPETGLETLEAAKGAAYRPAGLEGQGRD